MAANINSDIIFFFDIIWKEFRYKTFKSKNTWGQSCLINLVKGRVLFNFSLGVSLRCKSGGHTYAHTHTIVLCWGTRTSTARSDPFLSRVNVIVSIQCRRNTKYASFLWETDNAKDGISLLHDLRKGKININNDRLKDKRNTIRWNAATRGKKFHTHTHTHTHTQQVKRIWRLQKKREGYYQVQLKYVLWDLCASVFQNFCDIFFFFLSRKTGILCIILKSTKVNIIY